jgi:hypothetical protein
LNEKLPRFYPKVTQRIHSIALASRNSHADPDNPPVATTMEGAPGTIFALPKASITVLRGKVGALEN